MKARIEKGTLEAALMSVDDRGQPMRWTRRHAKMMAAQVYWHMAYQVRLGDHGEILAVGGFVWDSDAGAFEAWFSVWPGARQHMRIVLVACAKLLAQQRQAVSEPIFTAIDPARSKAGERIARLLKFKPRGSLDSGAQVWTYEG